MIRTTPEILPATAAITPPAPVGLEENSACGLPIGGRVLDSMEAWPNGLDVVDDVAFDELEEEEELGGDGAIVCLPLDMDVSIVVRTETGNGAKVP
jgi:hypothetical protein